MRFRVWGINYLQLWSIATVPLLFWVGFRLNDQRDVLFSSLFALYRPFVIWALPIYFVFSFAWIYLLKRGVFRSRNAFYALCGIQLVYELVTAVFERGFSRIGLGLVFLLFMAAIYRWLESRVTSAELNPQVEWFEGAPKVYPRVEAKIKIGDQWFEAQVRRIDPKGLFVFLKNWDQDMKLLRSRTPVEFELQFRAQQVDGEAKVASLFMNSEAQSQKPGIGLQFSPKDLYHLSQYTALVESLKGEGYV